jgi:hypothetical protein
MLCEELAQSAMDARRCGRSARFRVHVYRRLMLWRRNVCHQHARALAWSATTVEALA